MPHCRTAVHTWECTLANLAGGFANAARQHSFGVTKRYAWRNQLWQGVASLVHPSLDSSQRELTRATRQTATLKYRSEGQRAR